MLYKNRYVLFLMLFTLLAGCILYLPTHIEKRVLPGLAKKNGIHNFSCTIGRMGIFSTHLSRIHADMDDRNTLNISDIHINYSPKSLFKKTITSISVCGLKISCELKDGKLLNRMPGKSTQGPGAPFRPPVLIKKLSLTDSAIAIKEKDRQYYIPFELTARPEDKTCQTITGKLTIFPAGQKITASGTIDLAEKRGIFSVGGTKISLDSFATLTSKIPDFKLCGDMDLQAQGELRLEPFDIPWFESTVKIHRLDASFEDVAIRQNAPFSFIIDKQNKKQWHILSGPLKIIKPIPVELASMEGQASSADEKTTFSGKYKIYGEPFEPTDKIPLRVEDPLKIKGSFSGRADMETGLQLESSGRIINDNSASKCRMQISMADVEARNLEYRLALNSDGTISHIKAEVLGQSGRLTKPGLVAGTGRLSLGAESVITPDKITGSIRAGAEKISIKSKGGKVVFPRVDIKADLDNSNEILCNGRIDLHNGQFSREDVAAGGINISVPLVYPPRGKGPAGKFKIASLSQKNRNLGFIRGEIRQNRKKMNFSGIYKSLIFQDMEVTFKGVAAPASPTGEILKASLTSAYKPPIPLDGQVLSPSAKGIFMDGTVNLNGSLSLTNGSLICSANTSVKNASIHWPDKKLSVEGLDLDLSIPDLLNLASKPAQPLNFKKASLAGLEISNGRLVFSLEKGGGILVERANFNWCNGLISSEALRFVPGIDNYDFVLYCNRIDLALVLEQLAIARAEGSGRVSGRIPVTINKKKIRINKGFLYSTPGSGGVLHLEGAEILTSGIPSGTQQYAQLDLAREALKDFEYKWARVEIETTGEDLMVSMKFDGKPANTLPFVYKEEFGGFVRVGSDAMGSNFQGIRLDTNFSLPLDRIIQHKNLLKIIQ